MEFLTSTVRLRLPTTTSSPLFDYDFRLQLQLFMRNDQLRHNRPRYDPLDRLRRVRVDLPRPQRRNLVLFADIACPRNRAPDDDENPDDYPRPQRPETPDPGVDRRLVAARHLVRDLVALALRQPLAKAVRDQLPDQSRTRCHNQRND